MESDVEDVAFKSFRTGDRITLGSLTIEPVHVDHSVPGAYGLIIRTSNGTVVYTGDFRLHGAKSEMTCDSIEEARRAEPLAIVIEVTNMMGLISLFRE